MADLSDISLEGFEVILDRAVCPAHNHGRHGRAIVHSPGFYDNGGVGCSTTVCAHCIEDVTNVFAARFGAAVVRQFNR
jgi:hypothetical protein